MKKARAYFLPAVFERGEAIAVIQSPMAALAMPTVEYDRNPALTAKFLILRSNSLPLIDAYRTYLCGFQMRISKPARVTRDEA
jgi:hypothetical protein